MKAPTKGNHPVPILLEDGGDYTGKCSFNVSLGEKREEGDKLDVTCHFPMHVEINCPPLEDLIAKGQAKVVLSIEQPAAGAIREVYDYDEGFEYEMNPYDVRLGKIIEITPMIISLVKGQLRYDPKWMDPFYGHFGLDSFNLEKGMILGYGNTERIKTNPIKGLAQIVKLSLYPGRAHNLPPFKVDLNDNRITIFVTKEIQESYRLIVDNSNMWAPVVNSVLTYPVFYMVIESMIANPEAYSSYLWFDAIVGKINQVRSSRGLDEFTPSDQEEYDNFESKQDYIWSLTCQLLSDINGDMVTTSLQNVTKNM